MSAPSTALPRPTPLQVDLARRLAHDIAAGRYPQGSHLSEQALCAHYQVSRTPIRAALRLVAQQGLIAHRPNSGYTVANAGTPDAAALAGHAAGPTQDELCRRVVEDRAARALPETFSERDLIARYGAARSVVAKALVQLSADGLVEKRKGHGWQFAPSLANAQALAESYRFRMTVECAGLLEPTFQADPQALARMRAAHEAVLAGEVDMPAHAFFDLNASFHELLARFSGNRYILQAVQQQNQLRRLEEHRAYYHAARSVDSSREHLQILAAIESGDQEWAAQLMRQHLKTSLQLS